MQCDYIVISHLFQTKTSSRCHCVYSSCLQEHFCQLRKPQASGNIQGRLINDFFYSIYPLGGAPYMSSNIFFKLELFHFISLHITISKLTLPQGALQSPGPLEQAHWQWWQGRDMLSEKKQEYYSTDEGLDKRFCLPLQNYKSNGTLLTKSSFWTIKDY